MARRPIRQVDKSHNLKLYLLIPIPICSLVFSGAGGELFTGALFHAYSPPPGFCFDSLCTDVLMDDPNLEDYNMDVKVFALNFTDLPTHHLLYVR